VSHRIATALRGLVLVVGIAVTIAGAFALRIDDWPIYVAFVVLSLFLFGPAVEVVPGLTLPMPGLALCLGFLYVGGLPIVFLRNVAPPFLIQLVRWAVPRRWRTELVGLRWGRGPALPSWALDDDRATTAVAADWSAFSLGLGVRWGIVSLMVPEGPPYTDPLAIVVAETGGYACWALLSALPVLSFQAFQWSPSAEGPLRAVYRDLGLVMIVALTPFVLLIAYSYALHGLAGAVAWSMASLGLHLMLQRLNERRITVEEQNRRLETLNRELEHRERLSAIGKMSSVVSHQILQQLGIIRLHADLVRHVDAADASAAVVQAKENAGHIEDALDDVNRVLTDLLVFSRDLRLNLYEHPLDRLLAECVEECEPQAKARGVTLRLESPADVTVTLDKLKVKQAIVNVVRNAIDASRPGGEVRIEGSLRDGTAEIAIQDSGRGIAAADRDAVFSPFFTTKETGTGLGLSIAREFVSAHGGRIDVEDVPGGGGARFMIRLPLHPAPSVS
jgi:signal transduction histidine kinase